MKSVESDTHRYSGISSVSGFVDFCSFQLLDCWCFKQSSAYFLTSLAILLNVPFLTSPIIFAQSWHALCKIERLPILESWAILEIAYTDLHCTYNLQYMEVIGCQFGTSESTFQLHPSFWITRPDTIYGLHKRSRDLINFVPRYNTGNLDKAYFSVVYDSFSVWNSSQGVSKDMNLPKLQSHSEESKVSYHFPSSRFFPD